MKSALNRDSNEELTAWKAALVVAFQWVCLKSHDQRGFVRQWPVAFHASCLRVWLAVRSCLGQLATVTFLAIGALLTTTASSHPGIGYNLRAIHLERQTNAIIAFCRLSLPLIVARQLGARRADGSFEPAPFTINRLESGQVFHYLNIAAAKADGAQLGKLMAAGHELSVNGKVVEPTVQAVRIHRKGKVPPFSTLPEAKSAVAGAVYDGSEEEIDAGYVLVDAVLAYRTNAPLGAIGLRSSLVPGELGESLTRNIVWDHIGDKIHTYDLKGLLDTAVTIDPANPPVIRSD